MTPVVHFLPRPVSIFILVFSATLFASNHIGANFAFQDGTGLLLAILARSAMALFLMSALAVIYKSSLRIPPPLRKWQLLLGLLITLQSIFLYSAITRIPIAMALLLVNTWPMIFILASWFFKKSQPSLKVFAVLVFILFGLYLVLDIPEGQSFDLQWLTGVLLAQVSAILIAWVMWISQYQMAPVSGSVRSAYTMLFVVMSCLIAGSMDLFSHTMTLPSTQTGWLGLLALAITYGTASTLLFVLAPKLNMAKNSPVLNAEPIASLILSYSLLGQTLAGLQLVGGTIVVCGIIAVGLMK
jgi:drug/metabolite transporter (DMT)-like permease